MTAKTRLQNILIVDDNPTNLEVLSETLTRSGYQVSVAINGESAIQQVKYYLPSLILLDIMMPGISGFETCRLLKSNPASRNVPIIFMTALSDTENKIKGLNLGAVDYITKPFQQEEVLARVQVQLKIQRMVKTLEDQNQLLRNEIQKRQWAEASLISAKEEADKANRAKSEFLTNISHEIRTPLNGILGYTQILQDSANFNNEERKGLNVIHQCGTHLLTLINDVLDLSKVEAQELKVCSKSFKFSSFLNGIVELFGIPSEQKRISFINQFDVNLPKGVFGDEKRLRQVLINLIGNAIKFTNHGAVTFKVKVLENNKRSLDSDHLFKIRFLIEDTGVGISPEDLEKIFVPFEQAGNFNNQIQGTGLGLAISQEILGFMGSKIQVRSQRDEGSTFWFDLDLPEANDWNSSLQTSRHQSIVGYEGKPRKILVVDDRWENRSVILNLLQPFGFEVIEAVNGQEGIVKAMNNLPDLIITDLVMPVMDGFEFIRALRKDSNLKDICIIASSASVFETEKCASIAAGANEFLPKPISTDSLLEAIQSLLSLKWIHKDNENCQDSVQNSEVFKMSNKKSYDTEATLVPCLETLERLYNHAKKGDLDSILEEANRIKVLEVRLKPFAQELFRLAESFQIKQLQHFIQQHVEVY
jgi:CheY-like chemotaxis protein